MKDRRNKKIKEMLENYGIMMASAIPILLIFCILAFTLLGNPNNGNDKKGKGETESTESYAQMQSTSQTMPETETVDPMSLRKDAYPEIQDLMVRYFKAKLNCDVEELKQIVSPIDGYTMEGLEYDMGIPDSESFRRVEDYQNVACYTKPGLLDGTYVVWVYYETKYENIETGAPSMFKAYVCTGEEGVYIYNGAIEDEVSVYLEEASQDEDVTALIQSVNEQLTQACESDEALKGVYDILWGAVESEPETVEETEPEVAAE